jgi:hypothetical protein
LFKRLGQNGFVDLFQWHAKFIPITSAGISCERDNFTRSNWERDIVFFADAFSSSSSRASHSSLPVTDRFVPDLLQSLKCRVPLEPHSSQGALCCGLSAPRQAAPLRRYYLAQMDLR